MDNLVEKLRDYAIVVDGDAPIDRDTLRYWIREAIKELESLYVENSWLNVPEGQRI